MVSLDLQTGMGPDDPDKALPPSPERNNRVSPRQLSNSTPDANRERLAPFSSQWLTQYVSLPASCLGI